MPSGTFGSGVKRHLHHHPLGTPIRRKTNGRTARCAAVACSVCAILVLGVLVHNETSEKISQRNWGGGAAADGGDANAPSPTLKVRKQDYGAFTLLPRERVYKPLVAETPPPAVEDPWSVAAASSEVLHPTIPGAESEGHTEAGDLQGIKELLAAERVIVQLEAKLEANESDLLVAGQLDNNLQAVYDDSDALDEAEGARRKVDANLNELMNDLQKRVAGHGGDTTGSGKKAADLLQRALDLRSKLAADARKLTQREEDGAMAAARDELLAARQGGGGLGNIVSTVAKVQAGRRAYNTERAKEEGLRGRAMVAEDSLYTATTKLLSRLLGKDTSLEYRRRLRQASSSAQAG